MEQRHNVVDGGQEEEEVVDIALMTDCPRAPVQGFCRRPVATGTGRVAVAGQDIEISGGNNKNKIHKRIRLIYTLSSCSLTNIRSNRKLTSIIELIERNGKYKELLLDSYVKLIQFWERLISRLIVASKFR